MNPTTATAVANEGIRLTTNSLWRHLIAHRDAISGPDRAQLVLTAQYGRVISVHARPAPFTLGASAFSRDVEEAFRRYEVGAAVPIVLTQVAPRPVSIAWVSPLPWGPRRLYCDRCAARLRPDGTPEEPHSCGALPERGRQLSDEHVKGQGHGPNVSLGLGLGVRSDRCAGGAAPGAAPSAAPGAASGATPDATPGPTLARL